jgi:hypothetical protein
MANYKDLIANDDNHFLGLLTEDSLEIDLVPVDRARAEVDIHTCAARLSVNNIRLEYSQYFNCAINHFKKEGDPKFMAFWNVYDIAKALIPTDSRNITAMKVHYGVSPSSEIVLFFEPIALIANNNQPATGTVEYNVIESKHYFAFDPFLNRFNEMDSGLIKKYLDLYNESISIARNAGNLNFDKFSKGVDSEAVIFTFQQFLNVIWDNKDSGYELSIFNAVRLDSNYNIYRHSLYLAPNLVRPPRSIAPFAALGPLTGVYADLGHLCPPNCPRVKFIIE